MLKQTKKTYKDWDLKEIKSFFNQNIKNGIKVRTSGKGRPLTTVFFKDDFKKIEKLFKDKKKYRVFSIFENYLDEYKFSNILKKLAPIRNQKKQWAKKQKRTIEAVSQKLLAFLASSSQEFLQFLENKVFKIFISKTDLNNFVFFSLNSTNNIKVLMDFLCKTTCFGIELINSIFISKNNLSIPDSSSKIPENEALEVEILDNSFLTSFDSEEYEEEEEEEIPYKYIHHKKNGDFMTSEEVAEMQALALKSKPLTPKIAKELFAKLKKKFKASQEEGERKLLSLVSDPKVQKLLKLKKPRLKLEGGTKND